MMDKIMIIGVGGAGCNMADTFRKEANLKVIKNATYVFADMNKAGDEYVKAEDDGSFSLSLFNIDLHNDFPAGFFRDFDQVYILAGLGGKTGTNWAPVIAQIACFNDVKSVRAVVTTPFMFEGVKRLAFALEGLAKIKDLNLDSVIPLNNEKLVERYAYMNLFNVFNYADKAVLAATEESFGTNERLIIVE